MFFVSAFAVPVIVGHVRCWNVAGLFCSDRKLRWVLTNRLIKFFIEQSKRDPEKYLQFYDDYGIFFREGIVTTPEQEQRVGFF